MKRLFRLSMTVCAILVCSANVFAQDSTGVAQPSKGVKVMDYLAEHVTLSGYAHIGYDYDTYDGDEYASSVRYNRFFVQRAIFMLKYEPIKGVTLGFMGDLAKFKLQELYVQYKPFDALYIKAGQYKQPFTIENNISNSRLEQIWGAAPVNYFNAIDNSDPAFGSGSGRDIGIELGGSAIKVGKTQHYLLEYRVGLFNGEQASAFKDTNPFKDIVASLSVSPVKDFKLHGSVYFGTATAKGTNDYGIEADDEYRRDRWSVGVEYKYRQYFTLRSEYIEGLDADIKARGAYVLLVGSPVKWLDIHASVDYLNRNLAIGDTQTNYLFGLQWNFFRKCRLQVQYIYHDRVVYTPDVPSYYGSIPSSHEVVARVQIGF